ncbi:NACHT domain-containing protein [Streptomyces sp. ISL-14]|nr:NACHT domain-containing protein [Streptomyces sp. ISL-14]
MVLGKAGSGKSVLAIRFVLDLLQRPGDPDRVPVIFGLGSWNPDTDLRDWLADQLKRDHPGLAETGSDGSTWASMLVHGDRILPILDGFDEIDKDLQRSALGKLSGTASSEPMMPLLLTSRGDEYSAAGVLRAAAAIRLTDLSLDELAEYLPYTAKGTLPDGGGTSGDKVTVWDQVLKRLRNVSDGSADAPLATVLETPLMVALARTVYSETPDRDPYELLERFDTVEALEHHLLDSFVPTVYRDQCDDYRERVQDWLGYLAQHLGRLDSADLKWWELGSTLSRPVRLIVVGLVTGLSFGLVDGLVAGFTFAWQYGLVRGLLLGLTNGAVFGLVSGTTFALMYAFMDGGATREPSRIRMRIGNRTRRSRKTFVPRLVAGFTGGFGFGFVTWLVNTLVYGIVYGLPEGVTLRQYLLYGLVNGVMGGLVSGLALGFAHAGGESEPSHEPQGFKERMGEFRRRLVPRLAIGYAGGFGVGFAFYTLSNLVINLVQGHNGGFTFLLVDALKAGLTSGVWYGAVAGLVFGLAVALAEPIPIDSAASPSHQLKTNRRTVVHQLLLSGLAFGLLGWIGYGTQGRFLDWMVFTLVGGLGSGLAYGLSLTAWGHWVALARIWLPLTGRLPWAVNAFLEDAHHRGVLRQSGTVYQFRHARLQNHLAGAYEDRPE